MSTSRSDDYDPEPMEAARFGRPPGPPRGHRRVGVIAIAMVLAVAGFGGIVWYAYESARSLPAGAEPPLIRADAAPTRVRPEQPGGLEVPHQDRLVLQQLDPDHDGGAVERLLPPPEEPLPRPPPPPAIEAPALNRDPVSPAAATLEPRPVAEPPPAVEPAGGGEGPIAAVRPTPPPPPPESTPDPAPVPVAPAAPPPQPEPGPVPAAAPAPKPMPDPAPVPVAPAEPPPQPEPEPVPAAAPEPAPEPSPPSAAERYRVQMAAVRTAEGARSEWRRLQRRHPDLLGALDLQVESVDLGDRGIYYRVQAGPLSEAAAGSLCAGLKAQKTDCLVVRP